MGLDGSLGGVRNIEHLRVLFMTIQHCLSILDPKDEPERPLLEENSKSSQKRTFSI